ncbi:MAG: hypothetical protein ABIU97_10235 [Dehalococcoidia bacterium]
MTYRLAFVGIWTGGLAQSAAPNVTTPFDLVLQLGGLGLASYMVWWLTRTLTAELKGVRDVLALHRQMSERQVQATRDNTAAIRALGRKVIDALHQVG